MEGNKRLDVIDFLNNYYIKTAFKLALAEQGFVQSDCEFDYSVDSKTLTLKITIE